MRVKVEWRSASKDNYSNFCKSNNSIKLSFEEWKNIIYSFNDSFKEYILETGDKAKLPFGFGEFAISKKKRRKIKKAGDREFINLPIDWKKTKAKGKVIYNFNFHTEGYFFGWMWFKRSSMMKLVDLWYFKPTRTTSRLITHYVNIDTKYQHLYKEWK
jgi:nucleoid DNA-binding protein